MSLKNNNEIDRKQDVIKALDYAENPLKMGLTLKRCFFINQIKNL